MIDRLDESELRHELADALEQIDDYKKELNNIILEMKENE